LLGAGRRYYHGRRKKVTVQSQLTRRSHRSLTRTAAKIYFAPLIALLWLMGGLFVVGLAIFALQLLTALFRYLHL